LFDLAFDIHLLIFVLQGGGRGGFGDRGGRGGGRGGFGDRGGRGGSRGAARGGRGGARTGGIASFEGKKITF